MNIDRQVVEDLQALYCKDLKKLSQKTSFSLNDYELANSMINSMYKLSKMDEGGDSGYSGRRSYGGEWSAEGYYDHRGSQAMDMNKTYGPYESYRSAMMDAERDSRYSEEDRRSMRNARMY